MGWGIGSNISMEQASTTENKEPGSHNMRCCIDGGFWMLTKNVSFQGPMPGSGLMIHYA